MKDLFRRKELKYLLDAKQKERLLQALGPDLVPDAFFDYPVHSVYLDTPDYALFTNCERKPAYREKLRLRFYDNGQTFLEVKKKWKGVTHKNRCLLTPEQTETVLAGESLPRYSEAGGLLPEHPIHPVFEVRYHRLAWYWKDDPDLRVTLDEDLTWNKPGEQPQPLLEKGRYVLEIKSLAPFPLKLARTLNELDIWPCSASKAGNAFRQICLNNAKKGGLTWHSPHSPSRIPCS